MCFTAVFFTNFYSIWNFNGFIAFTTKNSKCKIVAVYTLSFDFFGCATDGASKIVFKYIYSASFIVQ